MNLIFRGVSCPFPVHFRFNLGHYGLFPVSIIIKRENKNLSEQVHLRMTHLMTSDKVLNLAGAPKLVYIIYYILEWTSLNAITPMSQSGGEVYYTTSKVSTLDYFFEQ